MIRKNNCIKISGKIKTKLDYKIIEKHDKKIEKFKREIWILWSNSMKNYKNTITSLINSCHIAIFLIILLVTRLIEFKITDFHLT